MHCLSAPGATLLGHLAPLPSSTVLFPSLYLYAYSGWVFCVFCMFFIYCAVVCIEPTCLESLILLLLLCGFGVSPLGCFVLLLYLCLYWCCFYTCLHLFSNLCCLDSYWRLLVSLGCSALLLAPIYELVLFVLLTVSVH